MSDSPPRTDSNENETRLWDEIDKVRVGMLGLISDPPQHFQPMTPFAEESAGAIWFFTRDDTDLARAVASGQGQAMFIIQSKDQDQDFQACVGGRLSLDLDRVRVERYWNAVVAAWYPQGKQDPHLSLLRLDCADAALWVSHAGPARFAWEIAKANITKTEPEVGERDSLNLSHPKPRQVM